jgi:hypothetical protein
LAASSERGSALILALILVVVLAFVGFGLLTRSLLTTRIAGSERWSTRAFYAADAGINIAKTRVHIRQTAPFTFKIADLRGPLGTGDVGEVDIQVSPFRGFGAPTPVFGFQVSGGQGAGTENLVLQYYQGNSTATQDFTRSERIVASIMGIEGAPVSIPQ